MNPAKFIRLRNVIFKRSYLPWRDRQWSLPQSVTILLPTPTRWFVGCELFLPVNLHRVRRPERRAKTNPDARRFECSPTCLSRSFTVLSPPCVTHSTPSGSPAASHKTLLLPPHPSGVSPLSLTVHTWIVRAFIVRALTARQEAIRVHTRYVLLPEIKLKIRVNVWLAGIWPCLRWHVSPSNI